MKINIHIDATDLFDIGAVEKAVRDEIEEAAHDVEMTAKNLVPVDTGALRNSIDSTGAGLSYEISANTEYAAPIEYGSAPHIIKGNPYLFWDSEIGAVKEVMHPGNKAYLYMTTAFESHTNDIDTRIANAIGKVI